MSLDRYPLPRTPIGFHLHPVVNSSRVPAAFGSPPEFYRYLRDELGVGLLTFICDPGGLAILDNIRAAVDLGILPVVRLQSDGGMPHPGMNVDREQVKRFVAAGARYLICGNEPDAPREWENAPDVWPLTGQYFIAALAAQQRHAWQEVIAGGGIAMWPAVTPGLGWRYDRDGNDVGVPDDVVSMASVLALADAEGWIGEIRDWCRQGLMAIALHNRPANHPLDYPDDPVNKADPGYFQNKPEWRTRIAAAGRAPDRLLHDSTGFRAYELVGRLFDQHRIEAVPIFGTEAGYTIESHEDGRYSKITDDGRPGTWRHADAEIAILERFRPDHPQRWQPAMLGVMFYHTGPGPGADSPSEAWWQNGLLGRTLDVVPALRRWWQDNAAAFANWPERWITPGMAPAPPVTPVQPIPVNPPFTPPEEPMSPVDATQDRRQVGVFAHVQDWSDGVVEWAIRADAGAIKILWPDAGKIQRIYDVRPATALVVRPYIGFDEEQSWRIAQGQAGGRGVADHIAALFVSEIAVARHHGQPVWAEAVNEPSRRFMWDDYRQYVDFTIGFAERCGQIGLRPLAYSWAPGNLPGYGWAGAGNPEHRNPAYPTFIESLAAHWRPFLPGLEACVANDGGLATHAYGGSDMTAEPWLTWYILRPRLDRQAITQVAPHLAGIPIWITEFGIDRALEGVAHFPDRGWSRVPDLTAGQYAEQIAVIMREYRRDRTPAALYLVGAAEDMRSFDTVRSPEIADRIAAVRREEQMPKPTSVEFTALPSTVTGGTTMHVEGLARGIDGGGMMTARFGLPAAPAGESEYGSGTNTRGIGFDSQGRFAFDILVPSVRQDVTGFLMLNTIELDPGDPNRTDDDTFDAAEFSTPILVQFAGERPDDGGTRPVPAIVDIAEISAGLDDLWALAEAFRVNNDPEHEQEIKAIMQRIKDAARIA